MNWLDLKLGGRMLVKYPGLTVVGGLAMSFAIWVGVIIFQVVTLFVYPTLPLPNGDRIVELSTQDIADNVGEERLLHDFLRWRDSLRTVTEVGAWRNSSRNLIVADGEARPVHVAEMSAAGFPIADGKPLMGRVLTADDERAAAPPVAVIGYEVWRTRFGGDPNVLGRDVQLGNDHATVVGVMREGFAFPVSHDLWLPLKTALLDQAPRSGPAISIFGLLAPGETLATAQAELTTIGQRAAIELPATHRHLQPRVSSFAMMLLPESNGGETTMMYSIYFFIALLLVLICGNVGLLLFARAATRESDLIVRTALGASRGRIVSQLFAEALVLGGISAVIGLAAADFALSRWGTAFLETNLGRLPFWFDLSISPATLLFVLVATIFGAAVAGVMPALKITRGMGDRLKQSTASAGGLKFGGVWSVVIVAQVAVTVIFPAMVWWEQFQMRRVQSFDPGFAVAQYLALTVERDYPVDRRASADAAIIARNARLAATLEGLRRRVAAQPGVAGVTFTQSLPTTDHPGALIEMGYDSSAPRATARSDADPPFRDATLAAVDTSYFDVLESPILAGRAFNVADAAAGARVTIVDQGFIDQVLEGRNPIGQQLRFANPGDPAGPSEWYEVIGVVKDLGVGAPYQRRRAAGFYLASAPETFDQINMLVHVRGGDPMLLAPQVREIATAVDPSLRLIDMQRVNEINDGIGWVMGLWMRITIVMSSVALLLSLAGIYAVMSFTVSKRTREIGVRVALGGSRQRILASIFHRPLAQMALGILAGMAIVTTAAVMWKDTEFPGAEEAGLSIEAVAMLLGYAAIMFGVCLLACVVPTRRALGVEPTVALRTE